MKTIVFLLVLFISNLAFAEIALYTSESLTPKKVNEISNVINGFAKNDSQKNILFYVHGRSKTLEKEWRNIQEVERVFNLKVIMLHWDSWNYMLSRPVGNAKNASQMLNDSIAEFAKIKEEHPEYFQNKKLFLLCHSMGNITFKSYIEKFETSKLDPKLFDSVILSGADTPFTKHYKWLKQVNFSPNINVIMNENDAVLLASSVHDYTTFNIQDDRLGLGLGLDNFLFFNKNTAENATYYDLTKVSGSEHRHYLSSRVEVRALFHYLFQESGELLNVPHNQSKNLIRLR